MEKILRKKDFPEWLKKLNGYSLYAPVKDGDLWNYELVSNPENINLNHSNTILSPKKIIFPQREVFLEFSTNDKGRLQVKENLPEEKKTVILGVRPCDAKAVTLTDKVFDGDIIDSYYNKRRKSAFLVGLACNEPPSENCFCLSVGGSPYSKEGLDILMTDLGNKYYIESLTEKGNELLNSAPNLFLEATAKDKKDSEKIHLESEKKLKRHIKDTAKIPAILKNMFDSPFWDEESMSCIRCGICTYLCPTCHCFDINDEVISTSPLKGKRVRTWDTCQFPDFTMHSSGHNPRPDKASRLRQRVLHKFLYFVERYNDYMCVGCGRCVSKCPVGIDIVEILNKVRDYES